MINKLVDSNNKFIFYKDRKMIKWICRFLVFFKLFVVLLCNFVNGYVYIFMSMYIYELYMCVFCIFF